LSVRENCGAELPVRALLPQRLRRIGLVEKDEKTNLWYVIQ